MNSANTVAGRFTLNCEGISRFAAPLIAFAGVGAALAWCFWPVLWQLYCDWQRDPNYSVGQLVPIIAVLLVCRARDDYRERWSGPCWWGIALLLAAFALRLFGLIYFFESAERYAVVVALAGLVLWIAGPRIFWRMRWVIAFLLLMVPLPGRVHNLIAAPLQDSATAGAVMLLEIVGVPVTRQGSTILLENQVALAVVEACSGLRMLTAFIVVAATFAALIDRPFWQRAIIVLSSIPIAVLCNVARLTVTSLLMLVTDGGLEQSLFHDLAGLCMMPPAVLLLLVELRVLDRLVRTDGGT